MKYFFIYNIIIDCPQANNKNKVKNKVKVKVKMSVYSKNSTNMINRSNDRSSTSKYCDVCYGAGKSFAEYTSHFVKSKVGPDGIVTCPTILDSVCTYCKGKGHFKSACEVLKAKNAKATTGATTGAATTSALKKSKTCIKKRQRNGDIITTTKNAFDCLRDDSDDDEYPINVPPLVRTNPPNIIPVRVFESSAIGAGSSTKISYVQALASTKTTGNASSYSSLKTNTKGSSLMKFITTANTPLPPLIEINSVSNPIGSALLHFVNNTVPPLVTLRRKISSNSAFNVNGTRKSWADYDSDTSSEGEDEDE